MNKAQEFKAIAAEHGVRQDFISGIISACHAKASEGFLECEFPNLYLIAGHPRPKPKEIAHLESMGFEVNQRIERDDTVVSGFCTILVISWANA